MVVIFVGLSIAKGDNKKADEFITIATGNVIETVTATGTVRPKNAASLRFESAGTISKLYFEVGAAVKTGDLLAMLNAGDLRQKVTQAEAELSAALVELENASQDVDDATVRSEQDLTSAYVTALAGIGDILNLSQTANDELKGVIKQGDVGDKMDFLDTLSDSNSIILYALRDITPSTPRAEIQAALSKVYEPLLDIQQVAIGVIRELKSLTSNTTNDGYRTSATEAQEDINEAIALVVANGKAIADASTDQKLDANTSNAKYRTALANVDTARANVAIARANLTNASLYAPLDGIIASKSKSIGEGVSATDQIYYLIGDGGLEVEANIPEVDIAKIAIGNLATVILDAYGEEQPFEVVITEIDPAETVIDGVATYKTTFSFTAEDARIRSGMTANIIVATQRRDGVLTVPMRAVFTKDGQRMVRLVRGEERVDTAVKLGLRGNDGMAEVVSGLSAGDTIVIEVNK